MNRARPKPDFIGIGAQKAATSWLWFVLDRHPGVWVPPIKELHYFDRKLTYLTPSYLATDSAWQRWRVDTPENREYRHTVRRKLGRAWRDRDWPALWWMRRYFFGHCDDDWYVRLFRPAGSRVCGEITPGYALLGHGDIARIRQRFPHLKILFLLRDPIDRAWSHARFLWTRGMSDTVENRQRVLHFLDGPRQRERGDYRGGLQRWEAHFPPEQFWIGFYDDIVERPETVVREVSDFLGVAPDGVPGEALRRRVNPSRPAAMPPAIERHLAGQYEPQLRWLSERFGGHADRWRARAETVLRDDRRDG